MISINQSIFPVCRVRNPFGTQCISNTFLHVGIDFRFHSTVYSLILILDIKFCDCILLQHRVHTEGGHSWMHTMLLVRTHIGILLKKIPPCTLDRLIVVISVAKRIRIVSLPGRFFSLFLSFFCLFFPFFSPKGSGFIHQEWTECQHATPYVYNWYGESELSADLVPSGNNSSMEPMLTKFSHAIWLIGPQRVDCGKTEILINKYVPLCMQQLMVKNLIDLNWIITNSICTTAS